MQYYICYCSIVNRLFRYFLKRRSYISLHKSLGDIKIHINVPTENLWSNKPSKLDTNYHSFRFMESANYFPTIILVPWNTRWQNLATKRQLSQLLKCCNRVGFMYCDLLIYWRTVKESLTCPRSVYFIWFDLVTILSAVVQPREITFS